MIAKIASATSSSTSVNPLLRYIGREPREDAVGISRIAHRQVDAADRGIGRVAHGLVDHEREPALLGGDARLLRRRVDAPRAQLGHAILLRSCRENPVARLEPAGV